MSDTEEYDLFFRNIVILLIRFESFNSFLNFLFIFMDETEFLWILKMAFILLLRGDRTEDDFVSWRKLL